MSDGSVVNAGYSGAGFCGHVKLLFDVSLSLQAGGGAS